MQLDLQVGELDLDRLRIQRAVSWDAFRDKDDKQWYANLPGNWVKSRLNTLPQNRVDWCKRVKNKQVRGSVFTFSQYGFLKFYNITQILSPFSERILPLCLARAFFPASMTHNQGGR